MPSITWHFFRFSLNIWTATHTIATMVLLGDCNSEIGAHVWSDLSYLIWWRQSQFFIYFQKIPNCLHTCATFSELPSNLSTIVTQTELCKTPKGNDKRNKYRNTEYLDMDPDSKSISMIIEKDKYIIRMSKIFDAFKSVDPSE